MSVEIPRMSKTIDKAADAANGAAERAESAAIDAARKAETLVREGIETLRTQTRAYADTAAEKLDNAQRVVVEHVREKPLQSTFGALGVGILIGLLLARRN